jgi:hypothetical protein
VAEWPCCHDPLRFSPMSLRFVPPPLNPTQLSFHAAPSTEVSPPTTTPLACLRFPSVPSKECATVSPNASVGAWHGLGGAVSRRVWGCVGGTAGVEHMGVLEEGLAALQSRQARGCSMLPQWCDAMHGQLAYDGLCGQHSRCLRMGCQHCEAGETRAC